MSIPHQTRRVKTWVAAKRLLEKEFQKTWMFRGHADARWDLSSNFERLPGPSKSVELYLLHEFQRSVHHYLPAHLIPKDSLEWLALMQHHGLPTRLIDFTRSPYVAAYFAIGNALDSTADFAIWCCFATSLQLRAQLVLEDYGYRVWGMNAPLNRDPHFRSIFLHGLSKHARAGALFPESADANYGLVYPVEPFRMNARLRAQRGLFLMTGNVNATLGQNMGSMPVICDTDPSPFMKVVIPGNQRRDAYRDLYRMGVTASQLFPDIDGFARDLADQARLGERSLPLDQLGTFVQEYTHPQPFRDTPARMLDGDAPNE